MPQKSTKPLSKTEHLTGTVLGSQNWEDLRVFYFVVACGSFREAGEALGRGYNAIRDRVAKLEEKYRTPLLIRDRRGTEPTSAGRELFDNIKKMAEAAAILGNDDLGLSEELAGRVSIRVTEGIGSFWLIPKISQFREKHPKIILDIQCEMRTPDLKKFEADIAVQLEMPTDENAIVSTLGYLHLMGFVSKEYIEQYGVPKWPIKPPHGFVFQVGPQMAHDELVSLLDVEALEEITVATTNSSTSHYYAVANGSGIGILPSYSRAISRKVIALDSGPQPYRRPIYLVYNKNMKKTGKIDAVIDWLKDVFDKKKYPWFSEEFIHPREIERYLDKDNVVELKRGVDGLIEL